MTAYEVPANRWVFKLAPQLSGKAQQAYAALSGEAAANYTQVKESILRRYDVNEETYKRRFRTASVRTGETVMELRVRLEDLAKKWLKECDTVDKLRDAVVLEQFLNSLPAEVRVWVQEHKPKTSEAAAQLADNYLQARQDSVVSEGSSTPNPIVCAKCNKRGHKARNCRVGVDDKTSSPPPRTEIPKRDLKDITCFTCNQKGHYASNCPSKTNLMCVERRSNFQGESELTQHTMEPKPGIFQAGTIEGHAVTDVCLDTGCTRTMVREDLVPVEKLIEGDSIAICCAHGDTVVYPLARIQVEVNGTTHKVEAAVSKTLPLSMLMGTDVPVLPALVAKKLGDCQEADTAWAVMTRAKKRAQDQAEATDRRNEEECGVRPNAVLTGGCEDTTNLPDFEDDLFGVVREKSLLTRSEKRAQRRRYQPIDEPMEETKRMCSGAEEVQKLQQEDVTLESIRKAADNPALTGGGFFKKNGLVYRRWLPKGRPRGDEVEQLVLPLKYRPEVLKLAHKTPFAGHLGRDKTVNRISQRFYWPTMFADMRRVVKTCHECQKTAPRGRFKAPLPIFSEPFRRIAMDIVRRIQAFKVYLLGRHFMVQTALTWLHRLNSQLTRWLYSRTTLKSSIDLESRMGMWTVSRGRLHRKTNSPSFT
ncbi:uncharacterized protein LOC135344837 [Halichondria panicea]|uniref:uncharacterized protein LOC135344837 n=1 Tax=Halichondria panicea TaxID=6063 RepID=UPI00312B48AD